MNISKHIHYIGCNDHQIKLFEGQYDVPNGMSYNSYLIEDNDEIAILDTVDKNYVAQWLNNIKTILGSRKPKYLVIHHVEPDHSAGIEKFLELYPQTTIVSSIAEFTFLNQFYQQQPITNKIVVKDNDQINIGDYKLIFYSAPFVHWPEVMISYEQKTKTLFSADAFGKFGALDVDEEWTCEARRYYFNIVGKFGLQVQALLNKLKNVMVDRICPLHGPILDKDIKKYIDIYNLWSSYEAEKNSFIVFYTSVYSHTKEAAQYLAKKLKCEAINLVGYDHSEAIEKAFEYKNIVLATTTYNNGIFPTMQNFINNLLAKNWQNKNIVLIENGTWAPMVATLLKQQLSTIKNMNIIATITIKSSMNQNNFQQIDDVVSKLLNK